MKWNDSDNKVTTQYHFGASQRLLFKNTVCHSWLTPRALHSSVFDHTYIYTLHVYSAHAYTPSRQDNTKVCCSEIFWNHGHTAFMQGEVQPSYASWVSPIFSLHQDLEIYSTHVTTWHHQILNEYVMSSTHGLLSRVVFPSSKLW